MTRLQDHENQLLMYKSVTVARLIYPSGSRKQSTSFVKNKQQKKEHPLTMLKIGSTMICTKVSFSLYQPCYIAQPSCICTICDSISTVSLTFFQLGFYHDIGYDILTMWYQTLTSHIRHHIHKCHQWHKICKFYLKGSFLLDWFLKSLLLSYAKDMATTMPQIEENERLKS